MNSDDALPPFEEVTQDEIKELVSIQEEIIGLAERYPNGNTEIYSDDDPTSVAFEIKRISSFSNVSDLTGIIEGFGSGNIDILSYPSPLGEILPEIFPNSKANISIRVALHTDEPTRSQVESSFNNDPSIILNIGTTYWFEESGKYIKISFLPAEVNVLSHGRSPILRVGWNEPFSVLSTMTTNEFDDLRKALNYIQSSLQNDLLELTN